MRPGFCLLVLCRGRDSDRRWSLGTGSGMQSAGRGTEAWASVTDAGGAAQRRATGARREKTETSGGRGGGRRRPAPNPPQGQRPPKGKASVQGRMLWVCFPPQVAKRGKALVCGGVSRVTAGREIRPDWPSSDFSWNPHRYRPVLASRGAAGGCRPSGPARHREGERASGECGRAGPRGRRRLGAWGRLRTVVGFPCSGSLGAHHPPSALRWACAACVGRGQPQAHRPCDPGRGCACSPPGDSCEDRGVRGATCFLARRGARAAVGLPRGDGLTGWAPLSFLGRWRTSPAPEQPENRAREETSTDLWFSKVPWGPACCRDPLPLTTYRTLLMAP